MKFAQQKHSKAIMPRCSTNLAPFTHDDVSRGIMQSNRECGVFLLGINQGE